jgi:hypothetical protein
MRMNSAQRVAGRGDGRIARSGKSVDWMGMLERELGESNFSPIFPMAELHYLKTMAKKIEHALIPLEVIAGKIFILRGHRVMLDRDLANSTASKPKPSIRP